MKEISTNEFEQEVLYAKASDITQAVDRALGFDVTRRTGAIRRMFAMSPFLHIVGVIRSQHPGAGVLTDRNLARGPLRLTDGVHSLLVLQFGPILVPTDLFPLHGRSALRGHI